MLHLAHRATIPGLRSAVVMAAGLGLAAGCAASPRAAPRVEPARPVAVAISGVHPWTVRPGSASRSHVLRIRAELISRVDSVERTDSLRATLAASWTSAPPPMGARDIPTRIAGTLTEYRVSFGEDPVAATPAALRLPLVFAAEQASPLQQPAFTLPRPEECLPSSAAVAALREIFLSPPAQLVAGLVWRDSAEYMTCRDSVPLTVTSVRTHRVLGAESRAGGIVILIERRSAVTMSGAGTQFGEPLQVVAEGSGVAQLEISLEGGGIVSGTGESELRMTMQGRRRAQTLVQRTRLTIAVP